MPFRNLSRAEFAHRSGRASDSAALDCVISSRWLRFDMSTFQPRFIAGPRAPHSERRFILFGVRSLSRMNALPTAVSRVLWPQNNSITTRGCLNMAISPSNVVGAKAHAAPKLAVQRHHAPHRARRRHLMNPVR